MKEAISTTGTQHLIAYCSAAGMGAFAASHTAGAQIVYTDLSSAPLTLGPSAAGNFFSTLNLDIDGGGTDLVFSVYNNPGNAYSVRVASQNNVRSRGDVGGYSYSPVIAFNAGDTIGSGIGQGDMPYGYVEYAPYLSFGANNTFTAGSYLGILLNSGNYAWVALEINTNFNGATNHHGLTISGYAYQSQGLNIHAGQTTDDSGDPDDPPEDPPDPVIPEPSEYAFGLGILALGAVGIRKWRQQKAAARSLSATEQNG